MAKKLFVSALMALSLSMGAFQLTANAPDPCDQCMDSCYMQNQNCLASGNSSSYCFSQRLMCKQDCVDDVCGW